MLKTIGCVLFITEIGVTARHYKLSRRDSHCLTDTMGKAFTKPFAVQMVAHNTLTAENGEIYKGFLCAICDLRFA